MSQLILSSGMGRQDTSIAVVFNSVAETFAGEAHGAVPKEMISLFMIHIFIRNEHACALP